MKYGRLVIVFVLLLAVFFVLRKKRNETYVPSPNQLEATDGDSKTSEIYYTTPASTQLEVSVATNADKIQASDTRNTTDEKDVPNLKLKKLNESLVKVEAFKDLNIFETLHEKLEENVTAENTMRTERIGKKFDFDPYFGKKLKLVELKQGSMILLDSGEKSEKFFRLLSSNNPTHEQYFFQSGKVYFKWSDVKASDAPICILKIGGLDGRLERADSLIFELDKIQFPILAYSGYQGVTIYLKQQNANLNYLESITCLVGISDANPDRYKQLQIVHLFATLDIQGSAHLD